MDPPLFCGQFGGRAPQAHQPLSAEMLPDGFLCNREPQDFGEVSGVKRRERTPHLWQWNQLLEPVEEDGVQAHPTWTQHTSANCASGASAAWGSREAESRDIAMQRVIEWELAEKGNFVEGPELAASLQMARVVPNL